MNSFSPIRHYICLVKTNAEFFFSWPTLLRSAKLAVSHLLVVPGSILTLIFSYILFVVHMQ